MIKAEELKLNNYVISNLHKGLITQIKNLNPNSVRLWANPFATYTYDDISPIPLTPEILIKCGLRFDIDGFFHLIDGDILIDNESMGVFIQNNDNSIVNICTKLLSIHQLQNLYFALTGHELTINL